MMFYLHEARAKQGSLIPNETFNRKELKERLEWKSQLKKYIFVSLGSCLDI